MTCCRKKENKRKKEKQKEKEEKKREKEDGGTGFRRKQAFWSVFAAFRPAEIIYTALNTYC